MSDYKIRVEVGSDYSLAVETAKINNNLDDLKIKIADKKKEKGKNILTFSDGSQIIIEDGASPYISEDGYWYIGCQSTGVKARAEHSFKELTPEEKEEIKGEKGDPLKFSDLTQSQKEELRGKQGYTGESSKIIKTEYDSAGNTVLTFNDGTKTTISKGKIGDKGNPGDSVSVASVTKSGTTNTVKFTDGKTMKVEDGKSVSVSSTRILDDGNTEILFTDGKKAIVKKGQDGTVKFDDLTEEQRKSLQVDVVDDLTSGGKDKALSAEQGKVLFQYANDGKDKIASAIVGKGVNASKNDSFNSLATKISNIKTGYGVGDVISEKNINVIKVNKPTPRIAWMHKAGFSSDFRIYRNAYHEECICYVYEKSLVTMSNFLKMNWTKTFDYEMCSMGSQKDGCIIALDHNDGLYKLNNSGDVVWNKTIFGKKYGQLFVDDSDNIYVSYNEELIKLTADGNLDWSLKIEGARVTGCAFDNDFIYAVLNDGNNMKINYNGSIVSKTKNSDKAFTCVVFDNDKEYLYMCDNRTPYYVNLKKVDKNFNVIWNKADAWMNNFYDIKVKSLVVDYQNNIYGAGDVMTELKGYQPDGSHIFSFSQWPSSTSGSKYISLDSENNIYVKSNGYIIKVEGVKNYKINGYEVIG